MFYFSHIQTPVATEAASTNQKKECDDRVIESPKAASPSGDYRVKYKHLIGGLECAEKTAIRMEPNRAFGYGRQGVIARLHARGPCNLHVVLRILAASIKVLHY